VSYLPTAALLRAPAAAPGGWRGPWTRQLAAFGDPLPGNDTWSDAAGAPRLAASAAEVRDIASELGGRHAVYLGAANRKAALLAALVDPPSVLHLATHGAADLVAGERSRLLFSPAAPGGASESLFLREVYDLPLGAVDLAVLSACDTERGPDVRGEGVQGFSRGLLAAGAARAVTTLWRVPDVAAAELMRVFYYHLQRGRPADDALAEAKRALIASGTLSHPHYWAAFVLTGATHPLARAVRWRDVAGVALVVVGLLAGVITIRMRRRQPV
ncbi:MAG: CHAT domain-containing protein, partial [Acidobacteria bacterium]|nr:CHAT domain-containing protein [Acidobacteriota bacterium]